MDCVHYRPAQWDDALIWLQVEEGRILLGASGIYWFQRRQGTIVLPLEQEAGKRRSQTS